MQQIIQNNKIGKPNLLHTTIKPKGIIKQAPQKEAYKSPTGPNMTQNSKAPAVLLRGNGEDS